VIANEHDQSAFGAARIGQAPSLAVHTLQAEVGGLPTEITDWGLQAYHDEAPFPLQFISDFTTHC
jgi:hypothetical protein